MLFNPVIIKEGLRMFRRARRVKKKGFKQYPGNAKQICQQIVKDCWNGTYFQVSTGHFCEFYCRDFGWCTEALLKLGYQKEVEQTLSYALERFKSHGQITTIISPSRKPFDFPYYGTDSVPFLIRSLRLLNNKKLIKKHEIFLNKEIEKYYDTVFDENSGLVRTDRYFSTMKDYAKRKSSCYSNVMVAMLKNNLSELPLNNPFKRINIKRNIKTELWNGEYFYDDLHKTDTVTGDANVLPFWSGVFTEKAMLKKAMEKIQENGLDKPFPLRYYHSKIKEHKMISIEFLVPDYERDTVWAHLGPMYIQLMKRLGKADTYIDDYRILIELHKNYLEIFNPDRSPYETFFYYTDEGMLWASMYLDVIK